MTKMTKVQALQLAVEAVKDEQAKEIFKKMIDSIVKSQEKAKARKQAKASEESEKYITIIVDILKEKGATIDDLKEAIKEGTQEELSTQKVSSLITKIKNDNNVTVELVGKKRFYKI